MGIAELMDRVDTFAELEQGWDSYDTARTPPAAERGCGWSAKFDTRLSREVGFVRMLTAPR